MRPTLQSMVLSLVAGPLVTAQTSTDIPKIFTIPHAANNYVKREVGSLK